MSGTSLDGIDAALIDIDGGEDGVRWNLIAFHEHAYTAQQRAAIHDVISNGNAMRLCMLHAELGEWLAAAAHDVASSAGIAIDRVDLIGSHGQTVWHVPPSNGERGATLQLGCAATIAERTGVAVVSDFRSRDVAAMGHGAPLVPWADQMLFAHDHHARVLVNIGGMANLTWVPPRGHAQDILAFDTGPGNVLIDAAMEIATDGAQTYDAGGAVARDGAINDGLVRSLLENDFFRMPPPRSTGRELFGRDYVNELVALNASRVFGGDRRAAARDLVPTLTELTARSIADAIRTWLPPTGAGEVIVTGGGARNDTLMRRLSELLAPTAVLSGATAGIDPDAKEAIVFAALAWAHAAGIPGNMPAATGAAGRRILGSFTPGTTRSTRT